MKRVGVFLLLGLLAFCNYGFAESAAKSNLPTIQEKTAGMKKFPGYFPFYWDEGTGKLWLEIDKWDTELLYVTSLPAGVGSHRIIGLDRGQLRTRRLVGFQRQGPKVLLVQPNLFYRSGSQEAPERVAVEESFADSVLWGFEVTAEEGNRVLVDATPFFLRNPTDLIERLQAENQGTYRIDVSRSAFYLPRTKNFPRNTEIETILTVVGDKPGEFIQQVVPEPHAITVRIHHSLVEPPDANYQSRVWHPLSGLYRLEYMDFTVPLGEPVVKRLVNRHRLRKKNPQLPVSEPLQPIVYYVDPAAPELIRSALIEGTSWWNEAFEAAGFKNTFQVKLLPEDADPMDVRYNVVQWIHRSSGGRSPSGAVIDPRTGEIIKGHITIASLRVRQHYLLAESLLGPYQEGKPASPAMREFALARLRQLVAHEVGHSLGLQHNFAASINNRASVMDYPHPFVKIDSEGSLDLSDAYAVGIGEWDKVAIAYGYQEFPNQAEEKKGLEGILRAAASRGLHFISGVDARPPGSAHPLAHIYDNGPNPIDELERLIQVRALALERFSPNSLQPGAPLARLEEALVPVYLFHRYQIEAVSKLLGGLYFTYAVRGKDRAVTEIVSPEEQRRALAALLTALEPEALAFPESVLRLIPPIPPGVFSWNHPREVFEGRTGRTFDPLSAAEALANLTVGLILHPERAARLVEYHARDSRQPSLAEVIDRVIEATWKSPPGSGYQAAIGQVVDSVVVYHLMELAGNEQAAPAVRAIALSKLNELHGWLDQQLDRLEDENQRAHFLFAALQIQRFRDNPTRPTYAQPLKLGFETDWEFPWLVW